MVLLLYRIWLPRCCECPKKRDDGTHGGLRSTVGPRSPRVPRLQPRSAAAKEWRVVPKHETDVTGRMPPAFVGSVEEFEIEPTVEANGNKPITPLSVSAKTALFQ